MFGLFMGPPRFLSDEDVLKSISTMPSEVIDILELYDVDIKEYFSYSSGLMQTLPLLQDYDFTKSDRKILIDYAISKMEEIIKKEKEYLKYLKKDVDKGDYTFIEIYKILEGRVKFRKIENESVKSIRKDLEKTKYKPKSIMTI